MIISKSQFLPMIDRSILSKEEAKKLEVEFFEIEILDLKGEIREIAMRSYHRLLKAVDKPIYLIRTDD